MCVLHCISSVLSFYTNLLSYYRLHKNDEYQSLLLHYQCCMTRNYISVLYVSMLLKTQHILSVYYCGTVELCHRRAVQYIGWFKLTGWRHKKSRRNPAFRVLKCFNFAGYIDTDRLFLCHDIHQRLRQSVRLNEILIYLRCLRYQKFV